VQIEWPNRLGVVERLAHAHEDDVGERREASVAGRAAAVPDLTRGRAHTQEPSEEAKTSAQEMHRSNERASERECERPRLSERTRGRRPQGTQKRAHLCEDFFGGEAAQEAHGPGAAKGAAPRAAHLLTSKRACEQASKLIRHAHAVRKQCLQVQPETQPQINRRY
jgi:hypothetical protein